MPEAEASAKENPTSALIEKDYFETYNILAYKNTFLRWCFFLLLFFFFRNFRVVLISWDKITFVDWVTVLSSIGLDNFLFQISFMHFTISIKALVFHNIAS